MSDLADPVPQFPLPSEVLKVREILKEDPDNPETWDKVWKAKITPWDGGASQPPLQEVIQSGEVAFSRQGRAMVPGCGSGYDVVYIAAALNLHGIGLDVSETALGIAREKLAALDAPPPAGVEFIKGDFFGLKLSDEEKVDLIYDYTFFVALPPLRRAEWGQQMANFIKPGGHLITLMFPTGELGDEGPPWPVLPEHYHAVLDANFVKVLEKVPQTSLASHAGREKIAVWKRV